MKLLNSALTNKYHLLNTGFFFLLFLTTYYLLLTTPVLAQTPQTNNLGTAGGTVGTWFVQPPDQWQQKVFGTAGGSAGTSIGAEQYGVFQITNLANLLNTFFSGGGQKLTYDSNGKPFYSYDGGAINFLSSTTGNIYAHPPASSVEYLADLGTNLGISKPAYAQGVGFNAFSPLLSLWKTLRDLAYLIFVIIFVIVGFMIMFRKKIDPRTVVTIQDALPNIVITLILVTFSYAIIGLLIDAMQLFNILAINIFLGKPGGGTIPTPAEIQTLITTNVLNLTWSFQNSTAKLGDAAKGVILDPNGAISIITKVGVDLVFKIALFFIMFKIFFMLLASYVSIVLAVIMAPLQILISALPGSKSGPFSWIKNLIADIAVFPASLVMFLIAARFTVPTDPPWGFLGGAVGGNAIGLTWSPPLIGDWSLGGGVGPLLGFGIIMAIPSVGHAIKEALEVKESAIGTGVEKEIKGGASFLPGIGGFVR